MNIISLPVLVSYFWHRSTRVWSIAITLGFYYHLKAYGLLEMSQALVGIKRRL